VDAVFNSATGFASQMQLTCRLVALYFSCHDVPFLVADPGSGALWGGVAMDKATSTVIFTLKPGQAVTLYGRAAAYTVRRGLLRWRRLRRFARRRRV
jgi:hypothetical protein